MEIAQVLKLNGYKYSHLQVVTNPMALAKIYKNRQGVQMMVVQGELLGSTSVPALEFITEILNGAHAG